MSTYREDLHTGRKVPIIETADLSKGVITTDKIADGAVVWNKLSSDVQQMILSGDDIIIGASSDVIRVGEQSSIMVRAYSYEEAKKIDIKRNGITIATGSGHEVIFLDVITPSSNSDIVYTAEVTINGLVRSKDTVVNVVSPIYYGTGLSYTDAMETTKTQVSPAGEYVFNVGSSGGYLFILVPDNMTINNATFNGITFPFNDPQHVIINGLGYYAYKGSNEYDEGVMTLIID